MKTQSFLLALFCVNGALSYAVPSNTTGIPGRIGYDEAALLLNDGIVKTTNKQLLKSHLHGIAPSPPADVFPKCITSGGTKCGPFQHLRKREDVQLIIPLADERFLGWDITMSTITHANEAPATVALTQGQTIANSISVTESFTATVETFLQVGTSIDYQWSETASLTGTVTMTIPKNKWGAIVSNPLTCRKRGYIFSGQPGSGQYDYFQADSFTQKTYSYGQNSLSWVKGVVTTCLGDGYPLKRCNGDGELE